MEEAAVGKKKECWCPTLRNCGGKGETAGGAANKRALSKASTRRNSFFLQHSCSKSLAGLWLLYQLGSGSWPDVEGGLGDSWFRNHQVVGMRPLLLLRDSMWPCRG